MYSYEAVVKGLERFIHEELVNKMSGIQRWIFGTGAEIALGRAHEMFEQYKDNELLHTLGIIDSNHMIDVECMYKALSKQAEHGNAMVDIPLMGTITLSKSDVDKLYRYIMD